MSRPMSMGATLMGLVAALSLVAPDAQAQDAGEP